MKKIWPKKKSHHKVREIICHFSRNERKSINFSLKFEICKNRRRETPKTRHSFHSPQFPYLYFNLSTIFKTSLKCLFICISDTRKTCLELYQKEEKNEMQINGMFSLSADGWGVGRSSGEWEVVEVLIEYKFDPITQYLINNDVFIIRITIVDSREKKCNAMQKHVAK